MTEKRTWYYEGNEKRAKTLNRLKWFWIFLLAWNFTFGIYDFTIGLWYIGIFMWVLMGLMAWMLRMNRDEYHRLENLDARLENLYIRTYGRTLPGE